MDYILEQQSPRAGLMQYIPAEWLEQKAGKSDLTGINWSLLFQLGLFAELNQFFLYYVNVLFPQSFVCKLSLKADILCGFFMGQEDCVLIV